MSSTVTLRYVRLDGRPREETFEADKLLAGSDVFPFWTFWYPEHEDGTVEVRFIANKEIAEIKLVGELEDNPKLASVTPLKPQGD